jgi:hypothetical protein
LLFVQALIAEFAPLLSRFAPYDAHSFVRDGTGAQPFAVGATRAADGTRSGRGSSLLPWTT